MKKKAEQKPKATKFDEGKPRFSTIPQKALMSVVRAFTYGANKYGTFNYCGEMEASRLIDAAQRHINSYLTGEETDESGNSHLSHAIASLMMLEEGMINGTIVDDRNQVYKSNNVRTNNSTTNKKGRSTTKKS